MSPAKLARPVHRGREYAARTTFESWDRAHQRSAPITRTARLGPEEERRRLRRDINTLRLTRLRAPGRPLRPHRRRHVHHPGTLQQILFSDSDYCVQQAFLVAEGNPHAIRRNEDIAAQPKLRLGVLTGAVEAAQATESGIPPGHVRRFDNPADLLHAVKAGRTDAATLTTISLANLAAQTNFDRIEVTEEFTHQGQPGCDSFGFRKYDSAFRDQFNQILTEVKQQGELIRIVEPFGFAEAAQASGRLTVDEPCTD
ncbi:MAG: transporter substrate-binding domain-containing protein [Acidimicrobiia bacterium]